MIRIVSCQLVIDKIEFSQKSSILIIFIKCVILINTCDINKSTWGDQQTNNLEPYGPIRLGLVIYKQLLVTPITFINQNNNFFVAQTIVLLLRDIDSLEVISYGEGDSLEEVTTILITITHTIPFINPSFIQFLYNPKPALPSSIAFSNSRVHLYIINNHQKPQYMNS